MNFYYGIFIFLIIFDVLTSLVVLAHIRHISFLQAKITALEASTDMLLDMQREQNKIMLAWIGRQ